MASVIRCDRCGKICDRYSIQLFDDTAHEYNGFIFTKDSRGYEYEGQKDLCPSCLSGLLKWFNNANQ